VFVHDFDSPNEAQTISRLFLKMTYFNFSVVRHSLTPLYLACGILLTLSMADPHRRLRQPHGCLHRRLGHYLRIHGGSPSRVRNKSHCCYEDIINHRNLNVRYPSVRTYGTRLLIKLTHILNTTI